LTYRFFELQTTAETAQLAEAVKRDQKTYADLLEDLTAHEEEIADLRAEIERRPRTVSDADSQLDVQSRMSLRKSLRSSGIFRKDLFAASPTHSTLTQGSDSGKQLLPTLAIGDLREDLQQEAATLCARLRDSLSTMRDGWQSGLKASLSFGEAQQRLERVGAGLVQLERDALRNRTVVLGTSVLELKNTVEARDTAVKQLTQKHSEARAETERLSTALNDREHELMSARERLNKLLHSMAEVQKAFDNQCAEMQTLRKDNTEKADDTARLSCLLEAERCSMLQANRRLQELQAHASDLEERLALIAGHYENCLRLASRSDPKDSMLALRLSPSYRTPGSLIGNGTLGLPSSEQLEKAEQSSSLSQKMQPAETPSEKSLTAPIIEQDVKATSSIDRAPTSSAQPVAAQADPQSVLMRNAQGEFLHTSLQYVRETLILELNSAVAALDETIRSLQERKQSLFRFARMDTKLSVTKRSAQVRQLARLYVR
jgi:predicted nuclease with TOPRIM domain